MNKPATVSAVVMALLCTPVAAQDFDALMLQHSKNTMPVGFQVKIPLGDFAKGEQRVQLNFGYSLNDGKGRYTLVPLAGYDNGAGGMHVLGVQMNASDGGLNSLKTSRILGAAFLGGVAILAVSSLSTKQKGDCPDGAAVDQRTGLCSF